MLFSMSIQQAGRIASLTGSVLNLVVIMLLSKVYTRLAQILTRWGEQAYPDVSPMIVKIMQNSWFINIILPPTEMHRTQTKYEDAFILKVFVFQFVNFYSSPMYIAFFKGRWVYSKHCWLRAKINRWIICAVFQGLLDILETIILCLGFEMKMWVYLGCYLVHFFFFLPFFHPFILIPYFFLNSWIALHNANKVCRLSDLIGSSYFIQCGASGCLIELAQELLVIMVGKQVISNVQEFVLP